MSSKELNELNPPPHLLVVILRILIKQTFVTDRFVYGYVHEKFQYFLWDKTFGGFKK